MLEIRQGAFGLAYGKPRVQARALVLLGFGLVETLPRCVVRCFVRRLALGHGTGVGIHGHSEIRVGAAGSGADSCTGSCAVGSRRAAGVDHAISTTFCLTSSSVVSGGVSLGVGSHDRCYSEPTLSELRDEQLVVYVQPVLSVELSQPRNLAWAAHVSRGLLSGEAVYGGQGAIVREQPDHRAGQLHIAAP